ncbi:23S rRNA pseudouridine(955/2504/2580) synthase RluC [Buchnera aphidicola]|uniref:Pseudouridine synthase n=1 Tax=Buchnera aphidicola (Aphis gossypii) TaxID=98785 RepID=A0A5J6ZDN4_9GAMM|nr:23S rRNA pseudouridine(955/2504/2580) synthase RluC [Buchnera aphidicola]QFQ32173.1 23S rRNA pseudouridine(955/2504/2580) synthase RluC [Buchnera aphidicola (Aphis gossypii)]UPT14699.1 23S rRNA pseudouridine(955/2504/2580) synthase RluC [Buchnera aphidicola (Aphis gossypii)]
MTYKILSASIIYINEDMINQRIDNFLKKKFKNIPKSMIYRIIRTGKIRVNKKRIKPNYKLKIGDNLKVPPIKIFVEEKKYCNIHHYQTNLSNNILYEDNYLLIINKPSGIAVHGGSGINFGVIEYFRKIRPLEKFLELVHRIDRDTSGILILAKKRTSLISMHQQIREKKIKKEYIALVHGLWPYDLQKISKPLLKINFKNKQKKMFINNYGKVSETYFKIKKQYSCTTLMSIFPKTGRTHQIRAHTSYAGHPILFDKRYGNLNLDQLIKNKINSSRLLLHAISIDFVHPNNNKILHIQAPLDMNIRNFLQNLV